MLNLGAHMSVSGGVDQALDRGNGIGCSTVQIFTKNNNQWNARELNESEISEFFRKREEFGISPVIAHDSYLINLASPKNDLWEKSFEAFKIEMLRCAALQIQFLVMHPGSHTGAGTQAGIELIVSAFERLFAELPEENLPLICLETTAGQGSNIGSSFKELASIIDGVSQPERIAVCLDTCHIFAAGYEIRTENGYKETIEEFDTVIGLDRLKVIHCNDSKKPFNSHVDRHEHIGKGCIGTEAFGFFLNDSRLQHLPFILETPKGPDLKEDIENLSTLKKLVQ